MSEFWYVDGAEAVPTSSNMSLALGRFNSTSLVPSTTQVRHATGYAYRNTSITSQTATLTLPASMISASFGAATYDSGAGPALSTSTTEARFNIVSGQWVAQLTSTSDTVLSGSTTGWRHLEVVVYISAGVVTAKYYMDGELVATKTRASGGGTAITTATLRVAGSAYCDDVVVHADSTAAITTGIGDIRVETLVPSDANVNTADGGTSYNTLASGASADYDVSSPVGSYAGGIIAVVAETVAAKDDAAAPTYARAKILIGATEYGAGTDETASVGTYRSYQYGQKGLSVADIDAIKVRVSAS